MALRMFLKIQINPSGSNFIKILGSYYKNNVWSLYFFVLRTFLLFQQFIFLFRPFIVYMESFWWVILKNNDY